jgi:hypothetical protein
MPADPIAEALSTQIQDIKRRLRELESHEYLQAMHCEECWSVPDDTEVTLGDDDDTVIEYDEDGDDRTEVTGAGWHFGDQLQVSIDQMIIRSLLRLLDGAYLNLGTDDDSSVRYDDGDDRVEITGTADWHFAAGLRLIWDHSIGDHLDQSEPFNSKGNSAATVQGAIDDLNGDGWVYVPAGTWSENLSLDEDNVVLFGSGWGSIIDGGTSGHAIDLRGTGNTIRDLQVKTTAGGGTGYDAVYAPLSTRATIDHVYVSESDDVGILTGADTLVCGNTYVTGTDGRAILADARVRIEGVLIYDSGSYGIYMANDGDDSVIVGNTIDTTGNDGIYIHGDAENCIVGGNRITNWTGEAIDDNSGTSTIGDNETA